MTDKAGFSLIEVLLALVLLGCLAAVATLQVAERDEQNGYDRTIEIMEDIRRAILGHENLYCNGQRQFSGYVADMGVLPALVDENGDIVDALVVENKGEKELVFAQPRSLWTRDINGNGSLDETGGDIPESCCWQYYGNERIWAGWRGPYLAKPEDGVLKDGWGNPLLFSDGELITLKDETVVEYALGPDPDAPMGGLKWLSGDPVSRGTYRCKINWAFPPGPDSINLTKNPLPGFATPFLNHSINDKYNKSWEDCWGEEPLPEALAPVITPKENLNDPEEENSDRYRSVLTNLYYGSGTLCIVSFGADGKPGGTGYNKDISMTIYPFEYTGEVAGMVGNDKEDFADYVSICYPKYEQGSSTNKSNFLKFRHVITVEDDIKVGEPDKDDKDDEDDEDEDEDDEDWCKNFRYGTAPDVDSTETPEADWNVDIPIGIRSIKAWKQESETNKRTYVFAVEPTGNFIGTIKANENQGK